MPPQTGLSEADVAARRPQIIFVLTAVIIPLLITGVATLIQISLLSSLPDEVVVHWDADRKANGHAPAWTVPLVTAILGIAITAALTWPTLSTLRHGTRGTAYRLLAAITCGLATLTAVLLTAILWPQVDGGEVSATTTLSASIGAALAIGLIIGVALSFAGRGDAPEPAVDPGRPQFTETTTAAGGIVAIILIGFGLALAVTLTNWTAGRGAIALAGPIALTVIIAAVSAIALAFRVSIDNTGLTVTSIAGFPRFRVLAADITDVTVAPVRPFADFGGYGVRIARGRTGVVLRKCDALVVTRSDGSTFTVTLDDAQTAATTLAALAVRARRELPTEEAEQ